MTNTQINSTKSLVVFFVSAFFLFTSAFAQPTEGMHFEHGISWQQLLEKAKKENKFIFVDCYTTWCGPCKMMSAQVFPLKEVGTFYNDNFIMAKVQMDTTNNDNEEVKSWFVTANEFVNKYGVRAYPTYLFFNASGEIVHRAVGSSTPDGFIAIGKNAMDKETQYYTIKRLYESGNRDTAFLLKLAKASTRAYDQPFAAKVSTDYLATQKNLLTADNIVLLSGSIKKSSSVGFKELLNNPSLFDKYNYPGFAQQTIHLIIIQEEIYPIIFGKKKTLADKLDWDAALLAANKKYPLYGTEAVDYCKISIAKQNNNWPAFSDAVTNYIKKYGSTISNNTLNNYAWSIFENCHDMACIEQALKWSKLSLAGEEKDYTLMDTYANLLHKAGKTKEAIEWETKAKNVASVENAKGCEATIEKMKKGEKTW